MGEAATSAQLSADGGQHTFEVSLDLVVPESNDPPAMFLQPRSTPCIVSFGFRVQPTVNFDDELGFETNEISDERAEWH